MIESSDSTSFGASSMTSVGVVPSASSFLCSQKGRGLAVLKSPGLALSSLGDAQVSCHLSSPMHVPMHWYTDLYALHVETGCVGGMEVGHDRGYRRGCGLWTGLKLRFTPVEVLFFFMRTFSIACCHIIGVSWGFYLRDICWHAPFPDSLLSAGPLWGPRQSPAAPTAMQGIVAPVLQQLSAFRFVGKSGAM